MAKTARAFASWCLLGLLLGPMPVVVAQTPQAPPVTVGPPRRAPSNPNQFLMQRLVPGQTLQTYLSRVRGDFRQIAGGTEEISQADLQAHERIQMSTTRALAAALQFMRADLDGDGTVTEDELREVIRRERVFTMPGVAEGGSATSFEERLNEQVANLMKADTNHDGRITWSEALAFVSQMPASANLPDPAGEPLRQILAIDTAGKGTVTLADVEAAAEAVFRAADTDGDGTISQQEFNAYRGFKLAPGQGESEEARMKREQARSEAAEEARNRREQARAEAAETARKRNEEARAQADAAKAEAEAQARAACAIPRASDAARVVVVSAYGADALASTAIGSQEVATGAGKIMIESGADPVYLVVVTFRPVIWQITGAVERVERLVLASAVTSPGPASADNVPLVGATGVSADRVTFVRRASCLSYFAEVPSSQAAITAAAVRRDTGKEPSLVAGHRFAEAFVPSGTLKPSSAANGSILIVNQQGSLQITQGGASRGGNVVVQSGPTDLHAELRRFYPGGVVDIEPGTVVASRTAARYEVLPQQAGLIQLEESGALSRNQRGEFLIHRQIRFPAELTGAQAARFLLLRGVPRPEGDPGHSCVIDEETGAPPDNDAVCR